MTTPSPAALKKILDEKRANESTPLSDVSQSNSNSDSTISTRKPSTSSQDKKQTSSPEASGTTAASRRNSSDVKKVFVPRNLPLRDHEGLEALRKSLRRSSPPKSGAGKGSSPRKTPAGQQASRTKQSHNKENN